MTSFVTTSMLRPAESAVAILAFVLFLSRCRFLDAVGGGRIRGGRHSCLRHTRACKRRGGSPGI
jgi:hypothetical protein